MVAELGFCFLVCFFFFLFFCLGGGGHFLFPAGEGATAVCPEAGHSPEKRPNICSDRISRGWGFLPGYREDVGGGGTTPL